MSLFLLPSYSQTTQSREVSIFWLHVLTTSGDFSGGVSIFWRNRSYMLTPSRLQSEYLTTKIDDHGIGRF